MQKMYWRPQRLSVRVLLVLAAVAAGSVIAVETVRHRERQPLYKEKLVAARLTRQAFTAIKDERHRRRIALDRQVDPARSGMIGELISPITTNTGHLAAKQTTINPNFAAAVVEMLRRAGVKRGATVTVGLSGSFPALNVATIAALKAMGLRPVVIASVGASQWGANHPELTWLDMERLLAEKKLLPYRSTAASPGGIDDRALGLSKKGRSLLDAAIARSGVTPIVPQSYADSLKQRMAIYREQTAETGVAAYINVGGGTTSVGTRAGKDLFKPGLNRRVPRGAGQLDSVMLRFANRGVPVIHLSKISKIAERFGLPLQPQVMPRIGEGRMFVQEGRNPWLAGGLLALMVVLLYAFLRLDLGHRLFSQHAPDKEAGSPEPMI